MTAATAPAPGRARSAVPGAGRSTSRTRSGTASFADGSARGALRKRAHGLDDHERVALAGDPDLFARAWPSPPRRCPPGRASARASSVSSLESGASRSSTRRWSRARSSSVRRRIGAPASSSSRAVPTTRIGQLEPASEERQEPEAHLVGPVEVLEDQHQRLRAGRDAGRAAPRSRRAGDSRTGPAGSRPGAPSSGSSRASSVRQAGSRLSSGSVSRRRGPARSASTHGANGRICSAS